MISERKFSTSYSSFWNQLLPTGDSFLRKINLTCERFCPPFETNIPPDRNKRAVINELSFRLFMRKSNGEKLDDKNISEIETSVRKYIVKLIRRADVSINKLSSLELDEAIELSKKLESFFRQTELKTLSFWPSFNGCGKIHKCNGDIVLSDKLIEVKAGNRKFRLNDLRQVITYLALNFSSKQYDLNTVILLNPRKGLSVEIGVEELILSCSRRKPVDVFLDIVEFVSSEIHSI